MSAYYEDDDCILPFAKVLRVYKAFDKITVRQCADASDNDSTGYVELRQPEATRFCNEYKVWLVKQK